MLYKSKISRILLLIFCGVMSSLPLSADDNAQLVYSKKNPSERKNNVRENALFQINKSFDIYGAIIREALASYVEQVDADELFNASILGLLDYLDPYSNYIDEEHSDEIDLITYGTYTGVGITVVERDSGLYVVGLHDGYSASRSGVRIGDRIIKVDSVYLSSNSNDELRKYTNGTIGESIEISVIREGRKDTLNFTLVREEIRVNNVTFSGLLPTHSKKMDATSSDTIGYIKIEHFSRRTADEVRASYYELTRKCKLKGLIIDLRDNPGGLLDAAVGVAELFLPQNTLIVSMRGKNPAENRFFYSDAIPVDTLIPIAVLINGLSASASEILAGAIQDNDRGVVLGEKSFGKGLVQTVLPLPYNANLKLTTAKYYTPSGRCIQKVDYSKHKTSNNHETQTFKTSNGRNLAESNGIIPDSTIKSQYHSDLVRDLIARNLLFDFATTFTSQLQKLPVGFAVNDDLVKKFFAYLQSRNYAFYSKQLKLFKELKDSIAELGLKNVLSEELASIEEELLEEEKELFEKNKEDIKLALYNEISSRFNTEKEQTLLTLGTDNLVLTAVSILKPETYRRLLMPVASK